MPDSPTPDAKSAQPEQLVEEWPWIDGVRRRGMSGGSYPVQVVSRDEAERRIADLTAALSECRERESHIRPLTDDERAWQYAGDDVIHEARQVSQAVGAVNSTPKLDAALKKYDEARDRALAAQPPSEASEAPIIRTHEVTPPVKLREQ